MLMALLLSYSASLLLSTQQVEAEGRPHGAGTCSKVSAR